MLLREQARNEASIRQASQLAGTLGFDCTAQGAATLSVRLSQERFQALFGMLPELLDEQRPGPFDAGRPPGFQELELPVPEPLRELVESISVVPPATRFR
jgi:hypothetical protein